MATQPPAIVPGPDADLDAALEPIRTLLAREEFQAAREACGRLGNDGPSAPARLLLEGRAAEGLGELETALELARRAVDLRPRNVRARLRLARCLWRNGEVAEALAEAERVADTAHGRPGALLRVADFFHEVGRLDEGYRCRLKAQLAAPEDPRVLAAVADSAAALGLREQAERHYDRALFHDPGQVLLLERRGRLRRSSEADHTANQLGYTLDRLEPDDPRRAPVCFALAQELEDLGHHEPAFGIWTEGARCRRLALGERSPSEGGWMRVVENAFPADWLAGIAEGERGEGAIFLTGLPGSGFGQATALLEHLPGALVIREPGFFADAVTRLVGPVDNREARLEASASLDPSALARTYGRAAHQLAGERRPLIDAAPAHLWLLGPIRAAFPAAKIIHLRRDPMDHCLELFTTLFPRGHAWSYDLDALARHFATCHRLMGHWRRHLPGGFLDLDYETLVDDPHAAAGQLADFLGTSRDAFGDPVEAIAGSLGVRGAGVGRWKFYEQQLTSLSKRLRLDGVPVA